MNIALNRTEVIYLTNKSGGAVSQGDVLIVDPANANGATSTTDAGYADGMIVVVLDSVIANNAKGLFAISGYVPKINLSSAAALGDLIKTHTVAKQGVPHAAPFANGDFGMVLETGATPAAILFSVPAQIAASATNFAPSGLTGATQASRYVGATVSGAPGSGTFAVGDFVIAQDGHVWICTVAGSPGTWVDASAGGALKAASMTILPFNYTSKQGTYVRLNNYLFYNTSNVNGDYLEFATYLPAGTFTFILTYSQGNNGGKLDIALDGSNIVTGIDCYGAGTDLQSVTTGVVVASEGFNKLIRITVNGKNVSSSAYYSFWSSLRIVQTA